MASTMADIRNALAVTLEQSGFQSYAKIPMTVNVPCIIVAPTPKPKTIDFSSSMGNTGAMYYFDLIVVASAADIDAGQDVLDQYLTANGPNSVNEFVFLNPQLGLPDVFARCVSASSYGMSTIAGTSYLSATVQTVVTVS